MDARPVGPAPADATSWRLNDEHARRTQGLVVSGFAHLPTGRALFVMQSAPGAAWLRALAKVAPPTSAERRVEGRAAAIAFTASGLAALGVAVSGPAGSPFPFGEGMFQEDRGRRLNDRWKGEWTETVIDGGPVWSGNVMGTGAPAAAAAPDPDLSTYTATGHDDRGVATRTTVHAMVLLYAEDDRDAEAFAREVDAEIHPAGARVVRTLPLELRPDEKGIAREHFGFSDGVSQPVPYDAEPIAGRPAVIARDGQALAADPWNGVPLGEILFGHMNGHHERAPGPSFDAAPPDIALDGTYLTVRELQQDVAAFWSSMERDAQAAIADDPEGAAHITAEWLAERAIGRTRDGLLLCPAGSVQQSADDNGFGFHERDPNGLGCPMGSHVRRGNPRDGLATRPGQRKTLLAAANRHRILRRARKYGPDLAPGAPDDGVARGLLFIALNTDIQRQFEFVQQTWMMNPNFATLYDETDPLIGPGGPMTVRDAPLRRRVHIDTLVRLAGGEYFFLPSLPAFDWLASR